MPLSDVWIDLQAAVNKAIKLEGKLKDEAFFNDIKECAITIKNQFTDATGEALHRLDKSKPSQDTVKQLIEGSPSALSYINDAGQLPVHSAVRSRRSVKYVPILAKEDLKHNVNDGDKRGGLLVVDPKDKLNRNTLQLLAKLGMSHARLDAMKELRKADLLVKEDIKDQNLLYWSCLSGRKLTFEYLAEWDPDCLITGTCKGLPLSHAIIKYHKKFTMYLRTSLKYHPQDIGLLFQKDNNGKTTFERAIEEHGKDKTFKAIQKCIPTNTTLPILHHAMRDAPEYLNALSTRYPSTMHLRDEHGRSFTQAKLAVGTNTFENDCVFFLRLSDDEIAEVDPVTRQYPFLMAATGESADLPTVYFLLSKNPSLLERYREQVHQEKTEEREEEARKRKRKRKRKRRSEQED